MRVEIDFDDAVDEYVKEKNRSSYNKPSTGEISRICANIIGVLSSYGDEAEAIFHILQESDTLMKEVKHLISESEKTYDE